MANQTFQEKIARKFPPDYRKELMSRIMEAVTKGESCFIVGVSGTGKSNLFRFIRSKEAKEKYLGQHPGNFAFIWADTNALAGELTAFHLYELILYNLIKWAEETQPQNISLFYLQELHEKVVMSENRALAQRHLETVMRYLFNKIDDLHIVLLFDEFEPIAQTLDFQFFRSLRWLRDEFKYHLVYIMAAHRSPMEVRREMFDQGEPFYELLAPNILGLPLYSPEDREFMIKELSNRYKTELRPSQKEIVINLSGGHGGLISAIFKILVKHTLPRELNWQIEKLLSYDSVAGECRKLWNSLGVEEQDALILMIKEDASADKLPALNSLLVKGIVSKDSDGHLSLFSPLFHAFLLTLLQAILQEQQAAGQAAGPQK